MDVNNRIRYTVEDVSSSRFYQMPKFLFEGDLKSLNNNSRVLYSLLRDRHDLSLQNKWYNDEGQVFLIFSRVNMQDMLGVTYKTAKKSIDQLIEFGLIQEEHFGLNKPNRIYLTKTFLTTSGLGDIPIPDLELFQSRSGNNSKSRSGDIPSQEVEIFPPNDTKSNHTDFIHTESINQSLLQTNNTSNIYSLPNNEKGQTDGLTEFEKVKIYFSEKLEFDTLKINYPHEHSLIEEIELCVIDMYFAEKVKVKGESKPQAIIRNSLHKLNYYHIDTLINKYKSFTMKITHPKAYMQTMIYNIAFESDLALTNQVQHDRWGQA